ncbi:hypothetical protein H0H92_008976, partial [Tricholoma furcatifolium]
MRLSVFSVLAAVLAASSVLAEPIRARSSVPAGFVTTQGQQFVLDGKPFWLPLLTTEADVESTFQQMQAAGVKVCRTWGFNVLEESEVAGALSTGLTYYQTWNGNNWSLNTDAQGLQRLDRVVELAGKYGIKLILNFTNNWVGYGGMELYIDYLIGTTNVTHDMFYTNPNTIASYQRYVQTIVERYKDSPNVFAWELMNEARCLGDLPAGPNCVPGSNTLYNWYKLMSDYVRSLDPYHMITTGGEGHFYWKSPEYADDYNFNGVAGEDFDLDMTLPNIDFGTYVSELLRCKRTLLTKSLFAAHVSSRMDYPGSNWTVEGWGLEWMQDHANAAKKANKPVILEEFGVIGLGEKRLHA